MSIWDNESQLYILCFQHLPRPREATKLAVSFLRQMMERYTEHPITAGRMAIVFGREGQDRPLNIMTFDGITLQIPGRY